MPDYPTITIGQLREALDGFPDDTRISFSGLSFMRIRPAGEGCVQVEFNEPVYLDAAGHVVVHSQK